MPYCTVTCPNKKCLASFRILWRIGGKKLSLNQVARFTCPTCGTSFERACVRLPVFTCAADPTQRTVTVDESCLVPPESTDE